MRPGTGRNVSCIVSDFPWYLGLPFFIQRCGSLIGNDTEIQLECPLTCHYTKLSCIITVAHALILYYSKSTALYAIECYKCVHYQLLPCCYVSMVNSTISSAMWVLYVSVWLLTAQDKAKYSYACIPFITTVTIFMIVLSCDSTGHKACKHNATLLSSTETL